MIDASLRGSHDLEKIIYELKKKIDILNEEIRSKNIHIKKLEQEIDKSIRSDN
jgi:peptidoglycan hydrolase CwlO-like protein